jgi:hypothetical protein
MAGDDCVATLSGDNQVELGFFQLDEAAPHYSKKHISCKYKLTSLCLFKRLFDQTPSGHTAFT